MNTGNSHLNLVNTDPARPRSTLRRDLAVALVVVAVLVVGALGGGLFRETPTAVAAAPAAAEPSQETAYFPSQYVNQGKEVSDPTPTF